MLEATGLTKHFGGLTAVANVSLTVEAGRITALIGPNGAGKTTLFSMVSGFLAPDAGSIRLEGEEILGLPAHRLARRGLVRTFQMVQPFAGLTVRENIAIGCHRLERGRAKALAAAETVAAGLGLTALLNRPAAALTIAGRKRLELARALATRPRLLLLDEMMAGLNPTEIADVVRTIQAIKDSGVAVFLIEHVMQAVMSLAEHIYVLNNGRLIASGAPSEVVGNPLVVEAYLGHGAAEHLSQRFGPSAGSRVPHA